MSSDSESDNYENAEEGQFTSEARSLKSRRNWSPLEIGSLCFVAVALFFIAIGCVGSFFHSANEKPLFSDRGQSQSPAFQGGEVEFVPEPLAVGGPGGGPGVPNASRAMDLSTSCAVLKSCNAYKPGAPCQCTTKCAKYGNCCSDYDSLCNGYRPQDQTLMHPSRAPTYTFYAYRSQADDNYPPLNTNLASLSGALWYLQNEVVNRCDSGRGHGEFGYRRFKITRILRYKITTKAPEPLFRKGMNFGTRVAFDSGKNTGSWDPWKDMHRNYDTYGFNVGCNILGKGPYPLCPSSQGNSEGFCPIEYPDPIWYSLPGPCPSQDIHSKSSQCQKDQPGGYCKGAPTGQGNCTWTYEEAGEIDIDELVGIKQAYGSHAEFCRRGCLEYVKYGWGRDKGKCMSWWDHRFDVSKNKWRMDQVDLAFKAKYPEMHSEKDLPLPPCDFNQGTFYQGL